MTQHNPPTPTVISTTTLQRNIGSIIRRVYRNKEHIIVERDGLPVIAILAIDEYEKVTDPDTTDA